MGDLNGRTGKIDDYVNDSADKHSPINVPFYTKDTGLNRNNQDINPTDEQGKIILDLCKSNSLRILNGRSYGDKEGSFTRYPQRMNEKPSLIDYALCGENLLDSIFSFSVLPFTELSDHCCISTNLRTNTVQKLTYLETPNFEGDAAGEGDQKLNPYMPKLTYDKDRKNVFTENLRNDPNLFKLRGLLNKCELSETDLNESIKRLNECILDNAKKSFPPKKIHKWKNGKPTKTL